jgi:L-amino acid N-acyltransferase YncA
MYSENNNITIRLAQENDFELIYTIWTDGIDNSFETSDLNLSELKKKFYSNFKNRKGIFNFWVACDNENQILGWQSLIRYSYNPFRENTYAESSTYISKVTRKRGVGKLLLEHVLCEAEKSDLEYVIGFVSTENQAALKTTKETGWIEVGIIPDSKKKKNKFRKTILVRPV